MSSLSSLSENLVQEIVEDYLSFKDVCSLSSGSKRLNLLVKEVALNLFNEMKHHPYVCNQGGIWGTRFGIAPQNSLLEKISKIFTLFEKSIEVRKRDIDPTIRPRLKLSSFRDVLHLDQTLRARAFMENSQSGVYTIREPLSDRDYHELNNFLKYLSQHQIPFSLNLPDQKKEILLFSSSEANYFEIIPYLLDHCNINASDVEYHWTSLHWACSKGNIETIKTLLEHRASVNVANVENLTPLHLLALKNCPEAMDLLIDAGANINARTDEFLSTPLHLAAQLGRYESVLKLLCRGADPMARDSGDAIPIQLTEDLEIKNLLICYMDYYYTTAAETSLQFTSFINLNN